MRIVVEPAVGVEKCYWRLIFVVIVVVLCGRNEGIHPGQDVHCLMMLDVATAIHTSQHFPAAAALIMQPQDNVFPSISGTLDIL